MAYKWFVFFSAQAKQDLRGIFDYIAYNLLQPEIAKGQIRRIMEKIRDLDEMPFRNPLYHEEPWRSKGLRFFPVDKYLIFYLPLEDIMRVHVVRIMYGGRDILSRLNEDN